MTKQHPITPPPELVRQWIPAGWDCSPNTFTTLLMRIADNAALWSHDHCKSKIKAATDQELEACVKWIEDRGIDGVFIYDEDAGNYILSEDFRAARRPKPSRLKEEVSQIIDCLIEGDCLNDDDAVTLLRVLEAFND